MGNIRSRSVPSNPSRNACVPSPPPAPPEVLIEAKCWAWSMTSGRRARKVYMIEGVVRARGCRRRAIHATLTRILEISLPGTSSSLKRAPVVSHATPRMYDVCVQFHDHSTKPIPQAPLADQVGQLHAPRLRVQRVPDSCLERWWNVEIRVIATRCQPTT